MDALLQLKVIHIFCG